MKLYKAVCALALCGMIFHMANRGEIGSFVDKIFPCVQPANNSMPCFYVYDIIAMFIAVAVTLFIAAVLVFRLFRYLKNKAA